MEETKNTLVLSRGQNKTEVVAVVRIGGDDNNNQPVGKAPEDIFPLEVWCTIFEKLKETNDLINCSNAHLHWRKGLKSKLTQFLFEQVFPILINNNAFPANPQQLFQRLLDLRRVCHSWRRTVDSFLSHHPCHFHLDEGCTHPTIIYTPQSRDGWDCYQTTYVYNFPSRDFIQHGVRLLNQQLIGRGSFFHGRSISLKDHNVTTAEHLTSFWNGARDTLSKVGEHIFYLEIDSVGTATEEQLRTVLKLVPNLKVLCVKFISVEHLAEALSTEPLPPLPKLEVLKIPSWREFPPIILQLLSSYTHIKKLGLMSFQYTPRNCRLEKNTTNQLLDGIKRPNLEGFCAPPTECEREVAQLRRYLRNYSTLQSVSLQVPYFGSSTGFQEILNDLGMRTNVNTLHLRLAVPRPMGNAQFQLFLQLPVLQKLSIDAGRSLGLVSIDCILPLKNLRMLTVLGVDLGGVDRRRVPKPTDEEVGNVINFLGWERRLHESNVWKLMPQLEKVLLKDRFLSDENTCYYDRSGYHKYWKEEQT